MTDRQPSTVPVAILRLLGLPLDADEQRAIDELQGVAAEALLWRTFRHGAPPGDERPEGEDGAVCPECGGPGIVPVKCESCGGSGEA